jgi:hypothetical protein
MLVAKKFSPVRPARQPVRDGMCLLVCFANVSFIFIQILRKNELTPDPNDYTAIISPAGKINKSGLIDAVMDEGIEIKRETVEDVGL